MEPWPFSIKNICHPPLHRSTPNTRAASKFFCRSLRQDSISELRESQAYCACKGFTWREAKDPQVAEDFCLTFQTWKRVESGC